ncbi:hypothetical protein [Rhizobium anhuiense]|uniref:hypothetical protein n=1 Tax=Rhizobium anhuiense TaxID=1184720 RepID=UPI001FEEC634|nr:hypothetical protein [Rhizobium anhuiense]
MTDENAARFPFFRDGFSTLTTRSLVVCADTADPHFTTRGPEWHADAFHDAPGRRSAINVARRRTRAWGIAGLDAKETETEASDVLAATKRRTLARLQTVLGVDGGAWPSACQALESKAGLLADVTQSQHQIR